MLASLVILQFALNNYTSCQSLHNICSQSKSHWPILLGHFSAGVDPVAIGFAENDTKNENHILPGRHIKTLLK
jgi:hypothetical protein